MFFYIFLPPGASGGIQALYLRKMRPASYYCATGVGQPKKTFLKCAWAGERAWDLIDLHLLPFALPPSYNLTLDND
jgi:hypothetical protein